jgi:hypothetical protein
VDEVGVEFVSTSAFRRLWVALTLLETVKFLWRSDFIE